MKTLSFLGIILIFVFGSCQQNTENKQDNTIAELTSEEVVAVDLADFESNAESLTGHKVLLRGTVDHVCKHGGQKMFLVKLDSDVRVKITTGENMAAFNTELEGETVKLTGIVDEQRIDEAYLRDWEQEILAGPVEGENSEHGEKVHMGEHNGEPVVEENPELKQINEYRKMIEDSGKEYISFFSVTCLDYEVEDAPTEEGV
jgi:hypothetical protein